MSLSLAGPGLGHGFIGQKAEILGPPIRMGLDVSDNGPHPLQVVDLGRSTKRLAVGVRRIKNLDYAHATAAEEIGPARYKIPAAAQIGGRA